MGFLCKEEQTMSSQFEWLREANEKFESCKYNWNGSKCKLDGYPVLDCPRCSSYKECKEKTKHENLD